MNNLLQGIICPPSINYVIPPGGLYTPGDFAGFANTNSSKITNACKSPSGKYDAAAIVEDGTASNVHYMTKSVAQSTTARAYVMTLWAKRLNGSRNLQIEASGATGDVYIVVDLTTFQKVDSFITVYSGISWKTTRYPGDWIKIEMTYTGVVDTGITIWIVMQNGINPTFSGDSVSKIALWGLDWR